MMDLAGWRMRDTIVGYGDFAQLYDRYAELTGEPVDLDAVRIHHFAFTLTNQLAFGAAMRDPQPDSDLMTNLQWCCETNLFATEALGEYLDVELPTVDIPEPRDSMAASAHEHLVRSLRLIEADDEYVRYKVRIAFRLARHLERIDQIGDAVVDADLDDLHRLLGRRPESWRDGEAELERFVLADAGVGTHDEALVALFHRRNLRARDAARSAGLGDGAPPADPALPRLTSPGSRQPGRSSAAARQATGWRASWSVSSPACVAEVDLVLLELPEIAGAGHRAGVAGPLGDLRHRRGVLDLDRLDLLVVDRWRGRAARREVEALVEQEHEQLGGVVDVLGDTRRWPSPRPWPRR